MTTQLIVNRHWSVIKTPRLYG